MKLTANDLFELKVIDKIIKEPQENSEENFKKVSYNLKKEIQKEIKQMQSLNEEEIVENRYAKFRNMGEFKEIQDVIKG